MQLKHITKVVKRLSIITTILLCYCTRPQIDATGSTKLTTITEEKNSSSQVIDEVKSNKGLSQAFLSQEGKKVNFIYQDGRWWAYVDKYCLPVYFKKGLSVEERGKHDSTWTQQRIHVFLPQ